MTYRWDDDQMQQAWLEASRQNYWLMFLDQLEPQVQFEMMVQPGSRGMPNHERPVHNPLELTVEIGGYGLKYSHQPYPARPGSDRLAAEPKDPSNYSLRRHYH